MVSGRTFGTVKRKCANKNYRFKRLLLLSSEFIQNSFGHEIAHGLGLNHDRSNETGNGYSFGHIFQVRQHIIIEFLVQHIPQAGHYRTIMAIDRGGEETRVNYYSNPDVYYKGLPTGTETDNNARLDLNYHHCCF